MILQSDDVYSAAQVRADMIFLRYLCKKNQVQLKPGTGLSQLIEECRVFLETDAVSDPKPLLVLFSLTSSLRDLWVHDVAFDIQLRAMNQGNYMYGSTDKEHDHFFKDFEFEIFSAAQIVKAGLATTLPQHTVGEDLRVGDIEIQCKHPTTPNQVEVLMRDFRIRLNNQNKYGVFGLAVEDCFGYPSNREFESVDEFNEFMNVHNTALEVQFKELYEQRLAHSTRILGMYTTASFFLKIKGLGARMLRLSNAVFCFRSDRKEITDDLMKQAYRLVSVFNERPNWMTIEKQKVV